MVCIDPGVRLLGSCGSCRYCAEIQELGRSRGVTLLYETGEVEEMDQDTMLQLARTLLTIINCH